MFISRHFYPLGFLLSFLMLSSCKVSEQEPSKKLAIASDPPPIQPIQPITPISHAKEREVGNAINEPIKELAQAPEEIIPALGPEPLVPEISLIEANHQASQGGVYYPPQLAGGGGGLRPEPDHDMQMLVHWNHVAINASGEDHELPSANIINIQAVREQMGPGRSSRALAIVHIAIFEAINAIKGRYKSYLDLPPADGPTSMRAAIAQAAHDTLAALFPSQAADFLMQLMMDLHDIPEGKQKERGVLLGAQAAETILALRANDGSAHPEPIVGVDYFPSDDPGQWRKDPVSGIPMALGAFWGNVQPFVLESGSQFRAPPPPALDSVAYTEAYNEVKSLGGDGILTPTDRTEEQTEIGIFWAYDGVPHLCAPPRLYNQIALQIADKMNTDMVELARLLALINVGLADAGIAIWESKFFYDFWRPITAIREADPGTGPSQLGDGNPDTDGDVNFSPLGAPASFTDGAPNFTPPFPAYPSGHGGFGGVIFEILRKFYGRDDIAFTFVSDEFNGITPGRDGIPRPYKPRSFTSFSQAEEENGQSRIYLGIHWAFDKTESIIQGNKIANHVWDHLYNPSTTAL